MTPDVARPPAPAGRGLFLWYWLPVFLYIGLIFTMSSIHGSSIPTFFPNVDKLEHLLEYSLFGLLAGRAIRFTMGGTRRARAAWATLAFCAVVAALDELYQKRVPGRSSDPRDWLTDVLAVSLAIALTQIVSARSITRAKAARGEDETKTR
ncbi:MAG: VanZ family protein [Hyphomicrobiales bacterium]